MAGEIDKPKGDLAARGVAGFDPLRLLRESIRAVPFMKYGLAVVGVFAIAAIVQGFRIGEFQFPLVTFACLLAAMVVLSVVAGVTRKPNKSIQFVGQFLVCVIVILIALGFIVLFAAVTLGWPRPLRELLSGTTDKVDKVIMNNLNYGPIQPKVIGIYPTDGFGPRRQKGLAAVISQVPPLKLVELSATTHQMKQNDIGALLEKLSSQLAGGNVVAVVGPPITECTRAVLAAVKASGKKVPIIIESAGSEGTVGWKDYNDEIPIFRLSTGVERRASEIGSFLNEAISAKVEVILLVEQDRSAPQATYGEHVYREVQSQVPSWTAGVDAGLARALYYPANRVNEAFSELRGIIGRPKVILLLGLGDAYRQIADEFFVKKGDGPAPRALLGGWMNAYAMEQPFREQSYFFENLFEITDFDFEPGGPLPRAKQFTEAFGLLSPALRDEAYSFDAGLCLSESYRALVAPFDQPARDSGQYPVADGLFLTKFAEILSSKEFIGITGDIRFDVPFRQNKCGRLNYTQFDEKQTKWQKVNYADLLRKLREITAEL
jgi:hypothetical protein